MTRQARVEVRLDLPDRDDGGGGQIISQWRLLESDTWDRAQIHTLATELVEAILDGYNISRCGRDPV